jgi:hypothetical protein
VLQRYTRSGWQRLIGLSWVGMALAWANSAWYLMFYRW